MPRLDRAQLQQMVAVGNDMHQRHRFLVQFVAAGLDPRQIENLVDEVEQMDARIVDVGGILLVDRHGMRAENFALHHLGESEDRIQRRAQLVAHLRQEARLGDVGGFGAVPRFVRDRLGLFELADQRVLFGARFQRRQRRRMELMGEQGKIGFGGDRKQRERVIVEGAAHR